MGDDATNQKKGIVTRGSGHIAESSGSSLPYYRILSVGNVMDDNHIETSKCAVPQAASRTFIQGHNVLHHQSKIGTPHGGGLSRYDKSHSYAQISYPAYEFWAEPTAKSPDTKVEGKWIVRSFDATKQDGGNGPGKFTPAPGRTEILDESELLFQQCSVDKIKLVCSHGRDSTTGELHVYIGDTVTVTAYRVNATETDPGKRLDVHCNIEQLRAKKNPPAEETQHAAFVLSRNGRIVWKDFIWPEIKNKTLVGTNGSETAPGATQAQQITTLTLGEDWLLKKKEEEPEDVDADRKDLGREAQKKALEGNVKQTTNHVNELKNSRGRQNRARQIRQGQSAQSRAQKSLNAFEKDEKAREMTNDAVDKVKFGIDTFKAVMLFFFFEPLVIQIEAHGCSPGANAIIKGYPEDEIEVDLTILADFKFRETLQQIKHLVTSILGFFQKIDGFKLNKYGSTQKAAIGADYYYFRGLANLDDCEPMLNLKLSWKELDRDVGGRKPRKKWQIHRAWEIEVGLERLLGLVITFKVNLNKCLGVAGVIADIITALGVECGIELVTDVNLAVGVSGTVGVDQYNEWILEPEAQFSAVLKIALVGRFGKFGYIELAVAGEWKPKIKLKKNDKDQAVVYREKSEFVIAVTIKAAVDVCGWDLSKSWELHRWPFDVAEGDMVIFGGGT